MQTDTTGYASTILSNVYSDHQHQAAPLYSADGVTLITDKNKIIERWAEHFNTCSTAF